MRRLTIEIDEALYEVLAAAGPTPEEAAAEALARAGSPDGADDGWVIWAELCHGVVSLGQVADYAGTIDDALYGPKPCLAE